MSNEAWYVSPDGQSRQGPLSTKQVQALIASGGATRASLAWREGMAGWAPLGQVAAFAAALGSTPPPIPRPVAPSGLPPVRMTIPPGELQPAPTKSSAGLIALIVGGVVLGLCVITAIPAAIMLPAFGKARASARQIKDSTQVRGVHQGLVLAAQGGPDSYPLPSQWDRAGNTVGGSKDDTTPKDLPRHITSIMLYNGFFSPEICVSPAEVNPAIQVYQGYQYSEPQAAAAADKKLALWDPAFRALPGDTAIGPNQTSASPGGFSYAYMIPLDGRRSKWSSTFQATEAVLGNRGPAYAPGGGAPVTSWVLDPNPAIDTLNYAKPVGSGSNTLLIHGGRTTWEGNIVYNDNHVNFETRPDPPTTPFTLNGLPAGRRAQPDNLFVNENDANQLPDGTGGSLTIGTDTANTNNYLRNWRDYSAAPGGKFPSSGTIQFWFD